VKLDVLGPVRVRRDGVDVDLGTPRQRAIVAALALSEGLVVPVGTLVERVWGDDPPAAVMGTLQSYVGGLRRALEPDRRPREEATVLVTEHDGYALRVPRSGRDDAALADASGRARELLRVVPDPLRPRAGADAAAACEEAVALLDTALSSWRGRPYADLADDADAEAERTRLADLRAAAVELRVVAMLALGRHDEVVPQLETMTRSHPLHERWWTLRAVALSRAGRQADALEVLQRLRSVLDDELGVEPSAPVRELQTAILRQDASVTWNGGDPDPAVVPLRTETPAPSTRIRVSPPLPAYELAGRVGELDRLRGLVERARAGHPGAAWVSGEAGIGKSRLAAEAAMIAFERGFVVATARCGQHGAPPLWPWREVLASVERQTGAVGDVDGLFAGDPDDFATRHAVALSLRATARATPVVVLVEDVHDADPATLDLLHHLVTSAADERLLLVVTRRTGSGDADRLVGLGAAVVRAGGARLDLGGLDPDESSALVGQVTGASLPPDEAAALRDRTGGNPFFLLELALAGGAVGGGIADVVGARLAELPDACRRVLEAASVIDVVFDEDLVAFALELEPAGVGAALVPALDAGMVLETDPVARVFGFAHAVVREVVRDGLGTQDRLWLHSRVATVIGERTGLRRVDQRTELARQWEEAGYPYSGPAWRSLVSAAEQAAVDSRYGEAAELLGRAATFQRHDLGSGDRERYELLLLLLDAQRWSGGWAALSVTVEEAVEVAERLGDPELVARAAMAPVEGAVWHVRTYGIVARRVVAALERLIPRLDATAASPALRARARLALATEIYHLGDVDRVDLLVEEAVAIADRAQDPRLSASVLTEAFSARWRGDTIAWRVDVAERALAAAVELGEERPQALALGLVACASMEAGDLATVRSVLPSALELAQRLGLITMEAVLRALQAPLSAMTHDDAVTDAALERLAELSTSGEVPNLDRAVEGTEALVALWRGDHERLAALGPRFVEERADDGIDMAHVAPWMMLRAGAGDLARALFPVVDVDLDDRSYLTVANASAACELGLGLGDEGLAARGYAAASPYAGRMASGGAAMAVGPVDGSLALGAKALGDVAAATAHADAAVALAREWGLPRYVEWLDAERDRHGF
jgi:DNA-binding SARP family transcriptional activator